MGSDWQEPNPTIAASDLLEVVSELAAQWTKHELSYLNMWRYVKALALPARSSTGPTRVVILF